MDHAQPASPLSRVPPPLAFVAAFLAGFFVQRLAWPGVPPPPVPLVAGGGALVGLGIVLVLSGISLLLLNRTTVIPHGTPTKFIARGPYRWTRNPMYLGVTLVYLGIAAWSATWLAIPFLALPLLHLSMWVIPMEESGLQAKFGQEYEDYRRRVRRWL